MTYRTNPILEKLDRAAELTGAPALARHARQHASLPFRIAPLLMLAFGLVGMFLQIRLGGSGWVAIMTLWITAIPLQLTGPMRPPAGGTFDERERALVRFGHFAGLMAVAILAIGGCFLAGFASAFLMMGWTGALWMPRGPQDWLALGFFLLLVEANVALLFVSWKMPWHAPVDHEA